MLLKTRVKKKFPSSDSEKIINNSVVLPKTDMNEFGSKWQEESNKLEVSCYH